MWHREQKPSTSEPGCDTRLRPRPTSNVDVQSFHEAKGFKWALAVPSGGGGALHSPSVEDWRAARRKAARHTGSRHALAIIEPRQSSKIRRWQDWHWPGFAVPFQ